MNPNGLPAAAVAGGGVKTSNCSAGASATTIGVVVTGARLPLDAWIVNVPGWFRTREGSVPTPLTIEMVSFATIALAVAR